MPLQLPASYILLLPPSAALGWQGIRTSQFIRHSKGSKADRLTVLVLGWSPLVSWTLALLISFLERKP
jgi:hypothetical protein